VEAEIGTLVGLGLYATKLYPATYTQHGKKYMGFSQQLNLTLAYLKENLVSLFERKLDIEEPHIFIFKRTPFLSTIENPLWIWYSSIHLVFYSSSCLKRGI
jgi:hypothetical protein